MRAWGCSHATREKTNELVGLSIRSKVQAINKYRKREGIEPPAAAAPEKLATGKAQPKDSGAPGWYFDFGELEALGEAQAARANEDQATEQQEEQAHEGNGKEQETGQQGRGQGQRTARSTHETHEDKKPGRKGGHRNTTKERIITPSDMSLKVRMASIKSRLR